MASIAALNIYPVKSCGGIALDRACLTATGFAYDREWMVIASNDEFVSQRLLPRMALISTRLAADVLELAAPGMPLLTVALAGVPGQLRRRVTVWRDVVAALDEGDEAARWLSDFLGMSLRLVRFAPDALRPGNSAVTGEYASYAKFADGYALLVIANASLADLNRRLARKSVSPLPMNRFRPNLVLDGDDLGPYDEDRMTWLRGEGIVLKPVKACVRCAITTTDQTTAVVQAEPLLTLASYRVNPDLGGPTFGQNAIVTAGAGRELQVGDRLEIEWNF